MRTDQSINTIPADPVANPARKTRRSGTRDRKRVPSPRPRVKAAQKKAGINDDISAPRGPSRDT